MDEQRKQRQTPENDPPFATTVVVPCYNEAERLDADTFVEFATDRAWLQLLFVDDGSVDRTAAVIASMMQRAPERIRCLSLPENSGKAEAVRQGIVDAMERGSRLVGFWDADLATPLIDIDRFRERFERRPKLQILMGSRVRLMGRQIVRSEMRHYFGRIAATVVARTLRIPVYDTQCGAKLFRVTPRLRKVFAEPFLTRWAFDVEILARWLIEGDAAIDVHRAICELPLERWTDVAGSKLKMSDFARAPLELWRIRRHYGVRIKKKG